MLAGSTAAARPGRCAPLWAGYDRAESGGGGDGGGEGRGVWVGRRGPRRRGGLAALRVSDYDRLGTMIIGWGEGMLVG